LHLQRWTVNSPLNLSPSLIRAKRQVFLVTRYFSAAMRARDFASADHPRRYRSLI
jgi:hypothetical protein